MKTLNFLIFFLISFAVSSQYINTPFESQFSSVTQRIGITDITVKYYSPAVKGRKIWGDVVPYKQVWRAGANENTTINFSHEVSINGKAIAAGTYGVHMIPGEEEWTVILSKNHTSWGSYFYKEAEDAIRVNVKAKPNAHTEYLTYSFSERAAESATLELQWEKLSVPFKIDVDVKNIVLSSIRNELKNIPGFTWQGFYNAAEFCFVNNINTEESNKWIERAEKMEPGSFDIMNLKSKILVKQGKLKESEEVMKKALLTATENQINGYGYELIGKGKIKEAIKVFEMNVKKYPESWNAYDSLAEALLKDGNKKGAQKNYTVALQKAPDDSKERIQGILNSMN